MNKTWNGCIKIFEDGEFNDNIDIDSTVFSSFNNYKNIQIPSKIK